MRRIAVATAILVAVLGTGAAAANVQPQPDIYAINWNGPSTERVDLTNDPAFDGWPSPSPDGRQIAFASTRGGFDAVWVMNSDGSDPRRLTDRLDKDVHDIGPITWSPNGTRIAFSAILEPPGTDARYWRYLIYVTPSSGGRAQRLDIDGWAPPSFSPDSQLLTYAVPSQFGPAIVVASADGSRARMLQPGSTAPAFAPRGRRILFLREPGRVATMDIGGRVRWTLRGYAAIAAEWARDGRVVFLANGLHRPGLYVVRVGSQRPRRVVDIAEPLSLVLSPDARYGAVSASGSTYIVQLAGGYFRRAGDEAGLMAWSPNDRELAFVAEYGSYALSVASVPGPTVQFGFPDTTEYFGLAWNGGSLLIGST